MRPARSARRRSKGRRSRLRPPRRPRRRSFGGLMALSAENTAALTRIAFDGVDQMWRNLRLAGRADIVRLSRQLRRNEDKLERVLQVVESLRDEMARERSEERARS